MATADVVIAEKAAQSLNNAASFLASVELTVPNTAPVGSPSTSVTVQKEVFVLNDESFCDLQLYIKAALRLPSSYASFEDTYPRSLFEQYTTVDTAAPTLYNFMRDTLVDIHQHSFHFQVNTLGPMVSLAGFIADFSGTADTRSAELHGLLNIILAEGAQIQDPPVKVAIENAQTVAYELSVAARRTSQRCGDTVRALESFKTLTEMDKDRLNQVNTRSDIVLPSMQQINATAQAEMQAYKDSLQAFVKRQNAARAEIKGNSTETWYYTLPGSDKGFAVQGTVFKQEAERRLFEAQELYSKALRSAGDRLATLMNFKTRTTNLVDSIDAVNDAIGNAITALGQMRAAFSIMETGLVALEDLLDAFKGFVGHDSASRRKRALKQLEDAGPHWSKVLGLAQKFQINGLLISAELNRPDPGWQPPPMLKIVAACYGASNVTDQAEVLFWDGENRTVVSVEPGFVEAWTGVPKSISLICSYGTNQRIFACREYTGFHTLKPGPVSNSQNGRSEFRELNPLAKPANARVTILAIVWGPSEIRSQTVWDYAYSCAGNGNKAIKWVSENFGGDTWRSNPKSGCIYYTINGVNGIRMIAGKDGSEAYWTI